VLNHRLEDRSPETPAPDSRSTLSTFREVEQLRLWKLVSVFELIPAPARPLGIIGE
jgi:hypothetical protein